MNEHPRKPVGLLRVLILLLVFSIGVAAFNFVHTNRVARDSERKWCAIISTIWTAQKGAPVSKDERINTYRRQIADLRHDLGCD